MGEEKKSGSDREEVEQVGPYRLREQVVQDEHSRGEFFRATHETSGATALVLKPATGDGAAALTDWRVRCISSASPGYLALEVEDSRWAVAPDKYPAEALMCLFEEVRDGVRRMAEALPDSNEPRLRWRLGLALASAAAVFALAFALGGLLPVSPPPLEPDALVRAAPASMRDTDTGLSPTGSSLWRTGENGGPHVLARPFPRKPYKGQRLPPCKPRVEMEIMGACWIPHKLKAPCPEDLYEHKGECYTASMIPPPPSQALGQ